MSRTCGSRVEGIAGCIVWIWGGVRLLEGGRKMGERPNLLHSGSEGAFTYWILFLSLCGRASAICTAALPG